MHLESPAPAICEKRVCLVLKSYELGFELQMRAKYEVFRKDLVNACLIGLQNSTKYIARLIGITNIALLLFQSDFNIWFLQCF